MASGSTKIDLMMKAEMIEHLEDEIQCGCL